MIGKDRTQWIKDKIAELGYEALGQRLRRARTKADLSVRDLADRANLNKNTITRIEKGQGIHLTTLKLICKALKLSPEELLSAGFDSKQTYAAHHHSDTKWMDMMAYTHYAETPELDRSKGRVPGQVPFNLLLSRDAEGRFNPNLIDLQEPTLTRSHRGEEFVFVVKGKMRVVFDQEVVDLSEGESIFFWAAENHRYEPLGEDPVQVLSIVLDPFPTKVTLNRQSSRSQA